MRPLIQEIQTAHTPESLVESLLDQPGVVLLRTSSFESPSARYSFVTAKPFLSFRSFGSRCEVGGDVQFGNPWRLLDSLMSRFELLDELDLPFPLGGCFGYWGYDLKNFVEPKLPRRAANDLELPDCHVGFYDSLVVFDHHLGKTWIVSTGLAADGSRTESRACEQLEFWRKVLASIPHCDENERTFPSAGLSQHLVNVRADDQSFALPPGEPPSSTMDTHRDHEPSWPARSLPLLCEVET